MKRQSIGGVGSVAAIAVLALVTVGCASSLDEGDGIDREPTAQVQQPLLADTLSPTVFAGATKSCVIEGGKLYCTGSNDQFGMTNYFVRVDLPGLPSVIDKVAIGRQHMCVLGGGAVTCWGNNDHGQVGCGCRANAQETRRYTNTIGNSGGFESCVASNACTTSNVVPTQVIASGATDIVAGSSKTCAIVNGYAQCWGASSYGQLGVGNTASDVVSPTYVCNEGTNPSATSCSPQYGVQKLTLGASHTCALVSGVVKCWGMNSVGQIGLGTTSSSVSIPTPLNIPLADQIVAGANHTCALAGGGMYCWGANDRGQIGDGTFTNRLAPLRVLGTASYVAAGSHHSCALTGNNVQCWGDNALGQLADSTRTSRAVPARVALPDGWGVARVVSSSEADHTLIQHQSGQLIGMGAQNYSQLGCGPTGSPSGSWCAAFEGAGRLENTTVESFYNGFLGRGSDRGGYVYWVNQLRDAQCTGNKFAVRDVTATVSAGFLESAEWWGRCSTYSDSDPLSWNASTSLKRNAATCRYSGGSPIRPSSTADYIFDVYAGFLLRQPDNNGWNFWTQQLLSGAETRNSIRWGFLTAREYIDDPSSFVPAGGVAYRTVKEGCMPHIR